MRANNENKIVAYVAKKLAFLFLLLIVMACDKNTDLDPDEGSNKRPYVQIKTPGTNDGFVRGDKINLTAAIYDLDSNITQIHVFIDDLPAITDEKNEFMVDTTSIDLFWYSPYDIASPMLYRFRYALNTEELSLGNHVLAIQAVDDHSCFIDSISFYLFERGTEHLIKDYDGNSYNTVRIGDQLWFSENLRTTHLNDGAAIPLNPYDYSWREEDRYKESYAWYDNDSTTRFSQGALYNTYSAVNSKLCPSGWHVPVLKEWEELFNFTDSTYGPFEKRYTNDGNSVYGYAGMAPVFMKQVGPKGNLFGFGATGSDKWWASTDSTNVYYVNTITFKNGNVNVENSGSGFRSVRCIKNKD
ncbi:MAG: FISUMP domain-containing protein [Prolixibacteraceae bacterium]